MQNYNDADESNEISFAAKRVFAPSATARGGASSV